MHCKLQEKLHRMTGPKLTLFFCVYFSREKFPAGRTNEHKCCYMGQIIEEGDTTELSDNHDDAESWYNWNILGHIQVGESNMTSIARFRG